MSETNQGTQSGGTPLWKRRSLWLGGGALAGVAVLLAAAPMVRARGFGGHGGFGHGRHGFGAQVLSDPEAAKRHAGMALEWVLRKFVNLL